MAASGSSSRLFEALLARLDLLLERVLIREQVALAFQPPLADQSAQIVADPDQGVPGLPVSRLGAVEKCEVVAGMQQVHLRLQVLGVAGVEAGEEVLGPA